jgi:hypothetical protein
MAWSTPLTAVANTALTAAQWNASVRDNLLETAPAKAGAAGRIMVTTGVNAIAERSWPSDVLDTSQTTVSTSYADLATVGPTVTVTSGTTVMIFVVCTMSNSGANNNFVGVDISGATTTAASDARALQHRSAAAGDTARFGMGYKTIVTAGSNTYLLKYRVDAGTGTFNNRQLMVFAL